MRLLPLCLVAATLLLLPRRCGAHSFTNATALRSYLARFGYLPPLGHGHGAGDGDLRAALKLYQSTLGLPATGRLDNLTLRLLTSPRCGVPDHPLPAGSRFAYFAGKPRWGWPSRHRRRRPTVLTYAVSTAGAAYLPPEAVRAVFRRAFARWARVIPVRFVETDAGAGGADVKVGFYAGQHGDGEPFDGQLGVLGHAFSPPGGQVHLDAAERWAVDLGAEAAAEAVDLESVATHEIGHVLGLAHSASPEAVMYPSLRPRSRKVELSADDVRGVQALYPPPPQRKSSLPDSTSAASGASVSMVAVALAPILFPMLVSLGVST